MMQLIRLFLLMLAPALFATCSYGQTIKGTVKDSTGKAVPYASINLKNKSDGAITAYTVTDNKGSFILQTPANTIANSVAVEVRCIGYKTEIKDLSAFDNPIDFLLTQTSKELQEVVIKSGNRPVLRTHGDTLNYKVSDFANPNDRTIGEVIKKLPGISVATDGTISYNNQPISALYLGGDNLLDDKYSIASNSIPQVAVNQVQVIQNNQPIKALQNKVLSNDVALNLVFKKGAKLHLIGEESIGVGLPGNYDVDLNALMFKDNYKAINYIGGNNTGYDVQQELVSHNIEEYLQRIDNALPATLLSLGSVNTPALAQSRYFFNQAAVVNLNNLINLKKNIQLRANAYYVHDKQKQDYNQQTTIFLPGDTVTYNEVQHNRSVPDVLHTQFTLNINRDKYYLNNVLLMDYKNSNIYSGLKTDSSVVNQMFKDKATNFSNEFNMIRSLKSNHIIQLYSYSSHSTEPEKRLITPGYNEAVFNNNASYAGLVQNVNIPGWYSNNYFSFKIPKGWLTQSYKTGFSVQSQRLLSDMNIVQNNNSVNGFDSALNHINWVKKKLYAEAAYDLPGSILKANLTLPLILQQINYSDTKFALDKSMTRFYLNPQLSVKYKVGKENYANLIYSYRNKVGSIEDVYPGYILTDYRTLNNNSANLTEQQNHQVGGGFSYRKALKLFFWSITAVYNHSKANNIASSIITNNMQQRIMLPYVNSTGSWMFNGSISKYSFALRTTLSAAIQWQRSRSVQIQNKLLLPFNTISKTFNASAATKVNNKINFNYAATLTLNSSHSAVASSAYQINQLLQQASINYNPVDAVQFKLSGEHYFTRQQGNPDLQYFFADASVKFRAKKMKTGFELSAVNLLNVKKYSAVFLSANAQASSSYTLPGRIVMCKILFNL